MKTVLIGTLMHALMALAVVLPVFGLVYLGASWTLAIAIGTGAFIGVGWVWTSKTQRPL